MTHRSGHYVRAQGRARLYFLSIFFVVALSVADTPRASALSTGSMGGLPAYPDPGIQYSDAWFIYGLDVGESREDTLRVSNPSDESRTLKLYAVDSVATGDGNFSLQSEDNPRVGVGDWIKLEQTLITLRPKEERDIRFTIAIPDTAAVGEHSGGIIIQEREAPEAGAGQAGASIVTRLGVRVYETVPGEIVKKVELGDFSITRFTPKGQRPFYRITLSAQNTSNVSLLAQAHLLVSGWGKLRYFPNSRFAGGLYLDFGDFFDFFKGEDFQNQWQLLRNQNVVTNWEWPEPAFGSYRFRARLSYEGVNGTETLVTPAINVNIVPWKQLATVLAVILVLALLMVWERMRTSGRKWQSYRVRHGDQLATVARKLGISWKQLAKVNKLKEPVIREGQTILIPRLTSVAPAGSETRQKSVSTSPVKRPARRARSRSTSKI